MAESRIEAVINILEKADDKRIQCNNKKLQEHMCRTFLSLKDWRTNDNNKVSKM